MNTEKLYLPAKIALLIPFLVGLLTVAELFLPLQKVNTVVESKRITESSKSGTTYSVDFLNNNDQFTEAIYNKLQEEDDVVLQVMRFSKEVKTVQLRGSSEVMENSTNEVYFQIGFAVVFLAVSGYFLRKRYYTNKNYRIIVIVSLIGLVSLIRIISLNV